MPFELVDLLFVMLLCDDDQVGHLADAFNPKRLTIRKVIHHQIHLVQSNAKLIKISIYNTTPPDQNRIFYSNSPE